MKSRNTRMLNRLKKYDAYNDKYVKKSFTGIWRNDTISYFV